MLLFLPAVQSRFLHPWDSCACVARQDFSRLDGRFGVHGPALRLLKTGQRSVDITVDNFVDCRSACTVWGRVDVPDRPATRVGEVTDACLPILVSRETSRGEMIICLWSLFWANFAHFRVKDPFSWSFPQALGTAHLAVDTSMFLARLRGPRAPIKVTCGFDCG